MGAQFLHLLVRSGGSHPCTPVNHATVVDLWCIISPYKNRITCIQSYKIVFVDLACNIQCILHQSCPMKTRKFTPMRNPVIWRTLCPVVGLGLNCGPFSAFYWNAQHLLLWAVLAGCVESNIGYEILDVCSSCF